MTKSLFTLATVTTLAFVVHAQPTATPANLDGEWAVVEGNSDGQAIPAEIINQLKLTAKFDSGKYIVSAGGKVVESGTYKVDSSKMPAQVDLDIEKGDDAGKKQLGIYRIEGDTLLYVLSKADLKERPKSFEPGKGIEFAKLKKTK